MLCPRCTFPALLFCLLAFFGCDSNNPGADLTEFEGRYAFTTLRFSTEGIQPADVIERLDPAYGPELEIDGSGHAILRYRRIGSGSQLITLNTHVSGNVLVLTPGIQDNAETISRELLFPPEGSLQLQKAGNTLTASRENYIVNLHAFDPEAYNQSLNAVQGTLTVVFTKE